MVTMLDFVYPNFGRSLNFFFQNLYEVLYFFLSLFCLYFFFKLNYDMWVQFENTYVHIKYWHYEVPKDLFGCKIHRAGRIWMLSPTFRSAMSDLMLRSSVVLIYKFLIYRSVLGRSMYQNAWTLYLQSGSMTLFSIFFPVCLEIAQKARLGFPLKLNRLIWFEHILICKYILT